MNQNQKGFLQVLRRMWVWLAAHPKVTELPMMAAFVIALGAAIDELSEAAAQQDSHFRAAKGATADAQRLRRELFEDHMRLVANVARVSIPDVVKVTAALKMPKRRGDHEGLFTSAEAMVKAAEEHQDALLKQGLTAAAIAEVRTVKDQYKAAIDARGNSIAQRRGATERVDAQREKARKLVDTISVLVVRALRNDRATLAEWTQLKRVTLKRVQGSNEVVQDAVQGTPVATKENEPATTTIIAPPAIPTPSTSEVVVPPTAQPATTFETPAEKGKTA